VLCEIQKKGMCCVFIFYPPVSEKQEVSGKHRILEKTSNSREDMHGVPPWVVTLKTHASYTRLCDTNQSILKSNVTATYRDNTT
jgi:hypothetical protein